MPKQKNYRVAVIGHTGRGNYGHGLDTVWKDVAKTTLVAVADADADGLTKATQRLGDSIKGFADYRTLLKEMKPDLVSIAPRWLDQHHAMTLAAIDSGVKGIYLEKPMCRSLTEADAMVTAAEKANTKLAIAFQTRYSPVLQVINDLIDSDEIGEVLEFRGRGKDDRRGGGEDLWVLGSHVMNLMHHLGGAPEWCSAKVYQGRKLVTKEHVLDGPEGIGPLTGDRLSAMYGLESGATAYFNSWRNQAGTPSRFGLKIMGSKGIIELYDVGHAPKAFWLPDPGWSPGRSGKEWIPLTTQGPGKPETFTGNGHHKGNVDACIDLIRAIEGDLQPEASIYEARTSVEMIAAVFESHRQNATVDLPLTSRENPLAHL